MRHRVGMIRIQRKGGGIMPAYVDDWPEGEEPEEEGKGVELSTEEIGIPFLTVVIALVKVTIDEGMEEIVLLLVLN